MSSDFVVHPIRWDRCPFAAADLHSCAWLTLQAHRGLTHNTLDAYSRALERYFRFLAELHFSCTSITRAEIGLYLASLQAKGVRTLECYDATAFNSGAPVPCISDGGGSARQQPGSN
ncbi:MAG TPA: site-specific integrase [Terracidiphilus sp.]|nr:site-specific integrase [Terracidiphilus sp.]